MKISGNKLKGFRSPDVILQLKNLELKVHDTDLGSHELSLGLIVQPETGEPYPLAVPIQAERGRLLECLQDISGELGLQFSFSSSQKNQGSGS